MKKKMNKNLTVGLWLTGIMLTLILVGFFWTPYNPETMDNAAKLSGVSFSHLMGCDNFGRDIFSRVLKGGGESRYYHRMDGNQLLSYCPDRKKGISSFCSCLPEQKKSGPFSFISHAETAIVSALSTMSKL